MSDIVISRAGSNSIFEFLSLCKPMLLIPLTKEQSRGDQILNARSFKDSGFCEILYEEQLSEETMVNATMSLFENRQTYIQNMINTEQKEALSFVIELIKQGGYQLSPQKDFSFWGFFCGNFSLGSVSDVVSSLKGDLLEEITHNNHTFFICLFKRPREKCLWKIIIGTGKELQLPNIIIIAVKSWGSCTKYRKDILLSIASIDYNDGNYSIDFDSGQITVYDFDNSCYCWYMFDLAGLWTHGVGWIQFEPDADKRKKFMDDYFETILAGYRSETGMEN